MTNRTVRNLSKACYYCHVNLLFPPHFQFLNVYFLPVAVTERSKTRVYGQSLAGIAGSNSAGGMDGYPL
jgi:hypothetical protein